MIFVTMDQNRPMASVFSPKKRFPSEQAKQEFGLLIRREGCKRIFFSSSVRRPNRIADFCGTSLARYPFEISKADFGRAHELFRGQHCARCHVRCTLIGRQCQEGGTSNASSSNGRGQLPYPRVLMVSEAGL